MLTEYKPKPEDSYMAINFCSEMCYLESFGNITSGFYYQKGTSATSVTLQARLSLKTDDTVVLVVNSTQKYFISGKKLLSNSSLCKKYDQ